MEPEIALTTDNLIEYLEITIKNEGFYQAQLQKIIGLTLGELKIAWLILIFREFEKTHEGKMALTNIQMALEEIKKSTSGNDRKLQ